MSKFKLDRVLANLQATKREIPQKLANQAVNHFTDNFNKQGFDGDRWKEVKRRIPGTREYLYPKRKGLSRRKKPILIGTGRLRRAVAASKQISTFNLIKLVVDLPYAKVHNEGGANTPKRVYMGDSRALKAKQVALIEKEIDRIWEV